MLTDNIIPEVFDHTDKSGIRRVTVYRDGVPLAQMSYYTLHQFAEICEARLNESLAFIYGCVPIQDYLIFGIMEFTYIGYDKVLSERCVDGEMEQCLKNSGGEIRYIRYRKDGFVEVSEDPLLF